MCSAVIDNRPFFRFVLTLAIVLPATLSAQTDDDYSSFMDDVMGEFEVFTEHVSATYDDFRQKANAEYAEFMRRKWREYGIEPPVEVPDVKPVPIPVRDDDAPAPEPIEIEYDEIDILPEPQPQPQPLSPIPEVVDRPVTDLDITFYGTGCRVRVPDSEPLLMTVNEEAIADLWVTYCSDDYNNLLIDCLALRDRLKLSDWGYFKMLGELSRAWLGCSNEAIVLWAFLFNQSGYTVRMGYSSRNLYLLVALDGQVFSRYPYYWVDGQRFFAVSAAPGDIPERMRIMAYRFEGEKEMDMNIYAGQLFTWSPSAPREMQSALDSDVKVTVEVNENLIDFYNDYPRTYSMPDPDGTSCWKFYANAPLNDEVKSELYPVLRRAIAGKGEIAAANVLIHFLQTTLTYRLDDEVWGGDRPFFAEETLFYPYSDCEDRAVLFSRLVRDLLGLDVVLLYLPGHLATAVAFNETLDAPYYLIDGRRYYYCEPTVSPYADVGWMPDSYKDVKADIIKLR